jgi:hypothetical protein
MDEPLPFEAFRARAVLDDCRVALPAMGPLKSGR